MFILYSKTSILLSSFAFRMGGKQNEIYSILYYLIAWRRVLLNSDFKTAAWCPQPYNSTQGDLLCCQDAVMPFVPEASALVAEAGAAVSGLPGCPGSGEKRSAGPRHVPQARRPHSSLCVLMRPAHQPEYCVFKVSSVITPWTAARPAPLSTGLSRQEYWSGWPCPPPGDLPSPGRSPRSPALGGGFFTTSATWTRVLRPARSASMSSCLG